MGIFDFLKSKSKAEPALEEVETEETEHRSDDRQNMYRDSRVYYKSGGSEPCIINDVSETGLRLSCQGAKSFPEQIRVMYGGNRRLCNVVWTNGIVAGLEFADVSAKQDTEETSEDLSDIA